MFEKLRTEMIEKKSQEAAPLSEDQARDYVFNDLVRRKSQVEIDSDGDIRLEIEDVTFYIRFSRASDRLLCMRVYTMVSFDESLLDKLIVTANVINCKYILGQAAVNVKENFITLSAANLFRNAEDAAEYVFLCLRLLLDFVAIVE